MYELIYGTVLPEEIIFSDFELSARLGGSLRDSVVAGAREELLRAVNAKYIATRVEISDICGDLVRLEPFEVASRSLAKYFSDCSHTYLFMATLGAEVDRLIAKRKARSLSEGFVFDAVASAAIEAVCDAAENKIHSYKNTKPRFSPGYADVPLLLQTRFIRLLSADKYLGISLTEAQLMLPMKSVSAFIGVLREDG